MIYYTECFPLKLDQRWCLSEAMKVCDNTAGFYFKILSVPFSKLRLKSARYLWMRYYCTGTKTVLLVLISSHLTNHAIAKRINNATLHPLTPSSLLLRSAEWGSTCVFCWQIGIQLFDLTLKCWLHRDTGKLGVCWIPRTEDTRESVVWGNGPEVCVQVSKYICINDVENLFPQSCSRESNLMLGQKALM